MTGTHLRYNDQAASARVFMTLAAIGSTVLTGAALAQQSTNQSSPPARVMIDDAPPSVMSRSFQQQVERSAREDENPHALRAVSTFAIAPELPRQFEEHDLVQIIVQESSRAKSKQELEAEKDWAINGEVAAWPHFGIDDLLQLQAFAGRTTNLPSVDVSFDKQFSGEGEYKREDDFTARLTAEVIEVLPNGNLVLEARTSIKTDEEEQVIKVTGICRPADVTPANTIISNQIHDLSIEKMHQGELKKASEKGIIAKVLDAIFAF